MNTLLPIIGCAFLRLLFKQLTCNTHGAVKCVRSLKKRASHEIETSGQLFQDGAQTLKIAWHPDGSESTRGTSLSQQDSKLSHEIEVSGQPVQHGTQTLKSHSIQKEATRIVCVLLTSKAIISSFKVVVSAKLEVDGLFKSIPYMRRAPVMPYVKQAQQQHFSLMLFIFIYEKALHNTRTKIIHYKTLLHIYWFKCNSELSSINQF